MSLQRNQRIFKKLTKVIPDLHILNEHRKLKASSMMDLNIDILQKESEVMIIAMSHYYLHDSGDMIADPDMEIKINFELQYAEALTYQDMFGYRQVYPEPGKYAPRAMKELNAFLDQWLSNIINSNYS